jgi:hypothetical protein
VAGFPGVTAGQIHKWVNDGLLPPTSKQHSAGRHGFVTVRKPGVEDQLIALCRLRAQTKSWNRLAVSLWLDGWQISSDRLRSALLAELPDTAELGVDPASDEGLDLLDAAAMSKGPAFSRRAGLGRVGKTNAAEAAFRAAMVAFGVSSLDEESAGLVEKLAGLSRARTDPLGDAQPWLDGPAEPLVDLSDLIGRMHELASRATEDELAAARPRARYLALDLPETTRALELCLGRNAGGLGVFARGHISPELALGLALFFAEAGLAGKMDAEAAAQSDLAAKIAPWMRLLEYYLARHPEQLGAVRKSGFQALINRGEFIPFEVGELEARFGDISFLALATPPTVPD